MDEPRKRPRIQFDCPEEVRRAVRIFAAKTGTDHSSVIVAALEAYIPEEIKEARKIVSSEELQPKSNRGRPRKNSSD